MNVALNLLRLSVIAATLAPTTSLVHAQYVFRALPPLPGGTNSSAQATSADGRVIVGLSLVNGNYAPVRWVDGVPQELGLLPGGRFPYVYGVSDDGSVVAGHMSTTSLPLPVRWDSSGAATPISLPPDRTYGFGYGVSGDGSTIVGGMGGPAGARAFRQVFNGTLQDLGTLGSSSYARSTNFDGSVVVGYSLAASGDRAFRWTEAGGMEDLGTLGSSFLSSTATSISANGLVIVGYSGRSASDYRAFRWTRETGMQNYGTLLSWDFSVFEDVSDDGSVLVGLVGIAGGANHAMAYFPSVGMVDLNSYLPTLGINLAGWDLYRAYGVSADGRTIVGAGTLNGVSTGWAFTIVPHPGTLALGLSSFLVLSRRRSR